MVIGILLITSLGYSQNNTQELWAGSQTEFFTGKKLDKLSTPEDFYNFARLRDEQFSESIKEVWHDYPIYPGVAEESRNSRIKQPSFNFSGLDLPSPATLPYSGVIKFSETGSDQANPFPRIRKPESDSFTSLKGSFQFYGQQINIHYDKLLTISVTNSVSEDSIAGFWNSFSRSNSNLLVDQLMDYRDRLGLGDWGYFLLLKATSSYLFPQNRWNSDQMTWGLMIRSGFDVKLAFNQSSTNLLFTSANLIFGKQFVMIGSKRYYLDREMKNPLLVASPNSFPEANRSIDLRLYKSLNFSGKLVANKFLVNWNKKKFDFVLRFNPGLIQFYSNYPKTESCVYFGAPVTTTLKEDLLRQLYPILSQFNKAEGAALLQQFIQFGFDYCPSNMRDEIPCRFPEEVVANKSGDDRGKSVFFTSLIRILLRLPVLGIEFPGYYSTAICFNEPVEGDSYVVKREKYIITDPTFQNIPIGILIPEMSGLIPQLIDVLNERLTQDNGLSIWNLVHKMGAQHGGADQDLIFDRQGSALLTGNFVGSKTNTPFIACFAENKALKWIRRFEGDGRASSFAITKVNEDEIYIAGTFCGKLEMDGKIIQSSSPNGGLFLAQFNQNGELIWMKPLPADSTNQMRSLSWVVKSDRPGNNLSFRWINEDQRNLKTGFVGVSETGLILTGPANFGFYYPTVPKLNGDLNRVTDKAYKTLQSVENHPRVAGVLALLQWLEKPGNELTGNQIQSFLRRNNPSFPVIHPGLFNTFGRIMSLKNENGIFLLKTSDNKSLMLNSLKVENGARFISTIFENGDISLDVISGFQNMGNPLFLKLNKLLIDSSAGNMIFDYDYDHTLKTVSPEAGS